MATDPICRMNVRETSASYTSTYEGKKFFFCSAACKERFDKSPDKYVN